MLQISKTPLADGVDGVIWKNDLQTIYGGIEEG
jgi:hypothetical protein